MKLFEHFEHFKPFEQHNHPTAPKKFLSAHPLLYL